MPSPVGSPGSEPADEAGIRAGVERVLERMVAASESRDPDRLRACYAERPVVALNGTIVPDYDARFGAIRDWLTALQSFEVRYSDVHLQALGPDAAVATMTHHLRWLDADGTPGEWNSAWTGVFQRTAGDWRIVYAHESTPPV